MAQRIAATCSTPRSTLMENFRFYFEIFDSQPDSVSAPKVTKHSYISREDCTSEQDPAE